MTGSLHPLQTAWRVLGSVAEPPLRAMLRWRLRRGKEIAARLGERRGREAGPRPSGPLLWLHAASVGETISVLPLLSALAAADPALHILMTTGTVTAAETLGQRLPALGLQSRVTHRFVPLDVPRWVARFLDGWRPDVAVLVESELWPNIVAACRKRGIRLALVNARLSARSAKGWGRAPGLARAMLGSFDRIAARSALDADRLAALGAPPAALLGDLKAAAPPLPADPAALARWRAALAGRPVWLAACTHADEEATVAALHPELAKAHPGLLTLIAPRHPVRGEAIARAIGGVLGARPGRQALDDALPAGDGVYLWDRLGDLGLLYRLSPVVFVGNSLGGAARGGHNLLEPARLGAAVATGPHAENFHEAASALSEAAALACVADGTALARWVSAMLADPAARARMAQAGQRVATQDSDLPSRIATLLLDLLPSPRMRP